MSNHFYYIQIRVYLKPVKSWYRLLSPLWEQKEFDEELTHHNVLHDRLQDHFLKDVLHQDEPRKILKDQLLKARQLLEFTVMVQIIIIITTRKHSNMISLFFSAEDILAAIHRIALWSTGQR